MFKNIKTHLFKKILSAQEENRKNILRMLPSEFNEETKILDLGCDDGSWTLSLSKNSPKVLLFGVEVVEERKKIAVNKGINVKSFDLNKSFYFEDNTFDIVHSNQVIEHLHDTDNFVSEVYRVLKPGEIFIVSTVNLSSWHNIFSLLLGYQPFDLSNISTKGNIGNPFSLWNNAESENSKHKSWQHMRIFTVYSLIDLLKKHGFTVLNVLTSGYYPLPNFFSKLDKKHSHYFVIKAQK
ncbi:methyltransferase domain-containing protein [candidate division WWE3 bacterium]|uniref:Methyltransferase domain-containing protein n=1 Tax=candidate division WWE3 bacterium TaxID=2053526 RepID=A0A7X9HTJ7_UNCKA|nr:methyltransferase domain-containing protein [candidate division WWE3 bacterium]